MLEKPVTRKEIYLATASGDYSGDLPAPITREEKYLKKIAENGGGGGSAPDLTNYYTKPQTDARITEKVAEIVSDAPEDFDTLKEISDWISGHEESAAAMNSVIQANTQAISGKVDKVSGMGLSQNSFTNAEKTKLAGIEEGATKTTVDSALSDSSTNPVENRAVTAAINILKSRSTVFGFRVNKNDSNPETRVEYLYDAVGMIPAKMDVNSGIFDYGSWADAWFIKGNKPCALKYNGTVDYYLNPNDYTKKENGSDSDVSDSSYAGNFMASMPLCYVKRWEDSNYEYYAISDNRIGDGYHAYAHTNAIGVVNDVIYLPMFKGAIIDGKMRSIAGVTPQGDTSGQEEFAAAQACGDGWQLWDFSKHELISDLLTLISRSTNSQDAFGQGDTNTYNVSDTVTYGKLTTGTTNAGQFWGGTDEQHVKTFHIEDFWGNRWERCLGLNLSDNEYVVKAIPPYALDTDETYSRTGLFAPNEGWLKSQTIRDFGALPLSVEASNSTYSCDYFYRTATGICLLLFGGRCGDKANCGSRYLYLNDVSDTRAWSIGGSPCFNNS